MCGAKSDVRFAPIAAAKTDFRKRSCPLYSRKRTCAVQSEMSASLIGQFGSSAFRLIHQYSVGVARGLVLLFGIGAKALPPWGSRTRRNDLWVGLAVR